MGDATLSENRGINSYNSCFTGDMHRRQQVTVLMKATYNSFFNDLHFAYITSYLLFHPRYNDKHGCNKFVSKQIDSSKQCFLCHFTYPRKQIFEIAGGGHLLINSSHSIVINDLAPLDVSSSDIPIPPCRPWWLKRTNVSNSTIDYAH